MGILEVMEFQTVLTEGSWHWWRRASLRGRGVLSFDASLVLHCWKAENKIRKP
jgi:hypothetical protein